MFWLGSSYKVLLLKGKYSEVNTKKTSPEIVHDERKKANKDISNNPRIEKR